MNIFMKCKPGDDIPAIHLHAQCVGNIFYLMKCGNCCITAIEKIKKSGKSGNIIGEIRVGLGRISGMAGYPAGYPATFNIRPDTGY